MQSDPSVPALQPRGDGHQFAFYGDCCSGIPGGPFEKTFASINRVIARLEPQPQFLWHLGDHIAGQRSDVDWLRREWKYWSETEMAWLDQKRTPLYHVTSNHDTFDTVAESVWREVFHNLPRNGPPGQELLSYWDRRGDLLIVCTNSFFSGLGGAGHVECEWLDRVLTENADARYKLVGGHYPVFGVNGYDEFPKWRIVPDEGRAFWSALTRHNVIAYLCSHVIAFDAQEHDGVLQICSGGAGTNYGPGGFMGEGEYHHVVQAAIDAEGFRYQVLDLEGHVRETLSRPLLARRP